MHWNEAPYNAAMCTGRMLCHESEQQRWASHTPIPVDLTLSAGDELIEMTSINMLLNSRGKKGTDKAYSDEDSLNPSTCPCIRLGAASTSDTSSLPLKDSFPVHFPLPTPPSPPFPARKKPSLKGLISAISAECLLGSH